MKFGIYFDQALLDTFPKFGPCQARKRKAYAAAARAKRTAENRRARKKIEELVRQERERQEKKRQAESQQLAKQITGLIGWRRPKSASPCCDICGLSHFETRLFQLTPFGRSQSWRCVRDLTRSERRALVNIYREAIAVLEFIE